MNRSPQWKPARLVGAGVLFAAVCAAPVLGQPGPGKEKSPAGKGVAKVEKVTFDHSHVRYVKRAAVAHKPFQVADPKTGKEVKHDTTLKLPNGKTVKAGEYYAELNKLEKKLNAMGHTLRDKSGKVVLAETRLDVAQHKQQLDSLHKKFVKFDAKSMRPAGKRADLAASFQKAKVDDKQRLARMAKVAPKVAAAGKTTRSVKTWGWSVGKKNVVAASLGGKLELKGSKDAVDILGEANAGGYLVNKQVKLLSARATVHAPQKGQSTARLVVSVLGNSVYDKNLSAATSQSWSNQFSKTFDYSTKFHFALGPIPCSVKLGAQGSAGLRYFIGVRPAHATAQVIPNAHARAYAQFAVDIVIASAGVGGQLRLVDFELRLGGDLGVNFDTSRAYVDEHFYAQYDLTMLSGSLYVFAEVYVPAFDIPPWHKKHYQWDLWKWAGFKKKGYLFNVSNKTYL